MIHLNASRCRLRRGIFNGGNVGGDSFSVTLQRLNTNLKNLYGSSISSNNSFSSIADDDDIAQTGEWAGCSQKFMAPIRISVRGTDILQDPLFNKGTAHKTGERDRLRFRGLLPNRRETIMLQKERFLNILRQEESNIKKNILLEDLHDNNETLYHRVLVDHIEEIAPLIYTPTVGQACKEFATRFRRPRGMYFTEEDRGHMAAMVYNWPHEDVHVIVVTDGSRILGLGDLGANGMGIPVGKLSLYCSAGGIAPHRVLPVVLDVGTNNEELLNDKFYLGVKKKRLEGKKYHSLVEEFMQAVRYRWPKVLVQFEDFSTDNAQVLLDKYRDKHLCFNDDVQGTGATTLAGLLGACRAKQKGDKIEKLSDQRILIAGAGSAGIGVAQVLQQAMVEQSKNESNDEHENENFANAFFVADQKGLISKARSGELSPEQVQFARDEDDVDGMPLIEIIRTYKPTILLGLTAVGQLFTEDIIREMAKYCDRPIIFPLSNPTSNAECTAEQAFNWTDGKCIFASGSPFDPVTIDDKLFYPTQCNNMYAFPGIGLGATVSGAKIVTDRMLYVAAEALANFVTPEEHNQGKVFPHISSIRRVSHSVAVAVAKEAIVAGLATKIDKEDFEILSPEGSYVGFDDEKLGKLMSDKMYFPEYVPLVEKREVLI